MVMGHWLVSMGTDGWLHFNLVSYILYFNALQIYTRSVSVKVGVLRTKTAVAYLGFCDGGGGGYNLPFVLISLCLIPIRHNVYITYIFSEAETFHHVPLVTPL